MIYILQRAWADDYPELIGAFDAVDTARKAAQTYMARYQWITKIEIHTLPDGIGDTVCVETVPALPVFTVPTAKQDHFAKNSAKLITKAALDILNQRVGGPDFWDSDAMRIRLPNNYTVRSKE